MWVFFRKERRDVTSHEQPPWCICETHKEKENRFSLKRLNTLCWPDFARPVPSLVIIIVNSNNGNKKNRDMASKNVTKKNPTTPNRFFVVESSVSPSKAKILSSGGTVLRLTSLDIGNI